MISLLYLPSSKRLFSFIILSCINKKLKFRESVDFVLDELKKMELGSSNLVIDGHFMPYTRSAVCHSTEQKKK